MQIQGLIFKGEKAKTILNADPDPGTPKCGSNADSDPKP